MSDNNDRSAMIRKAHSLPSGSEERRDMLAAVKQADLEKEAISKDTQEFTDWVMLNMADSPMSERAMVKVVEKILGREPSQYVAKTKRGPNAEVGDMLMAKPEKAPEVNKDVAEQFKYEPGTVEKVDRESILLKYKNGQTARYEGTKTGVTTGLYRYTPKHEVGGQKGKQTMVEAIYFSKPGEVNAYRKHVVSEYQERGEARGEDRKRPYYSGPITAFRYLKDGTSVISTILAQQRPYPVSLNPKKGDLLYLGILGRRPNWKGDYENDVSDLITESE
jgi:hypothetical protein